MPGFSPSQADWQSLQILQSRPGIEKHDPFLRPDRALSDEAAQTGQAGRTFRTGQNALLASQVAFGLVNSLFRHANRLPAGFTQRAQDQPIRVGLWNPKSSRPSFGSLPCYHAISALLERLNHRRATDGLDRDQPRPPSIDPTQGFELIKSLPHPDKPRSASGGKHDDLRQFPAKGLGQLEPHRLLTFHPIRFAKCRDVEPARSLNL